MPGEDNQLTTPAGGNQPEQTGLPPEQGNTADFLNSLGSHTVAETPEQAQIKELERKIEEARQMYSNMTDEEKARLSPLMREKYEALFGGQKPASETNVTATTPTADISAPASITTEPTVNPAEAGTKPLPGEYTESMAGVPGGGAKVTTAAVTGENMAKLAPNPATMKPVGPYSGPSKI